MPFAINQGFGSLVPNTYDDITEDYAVYLKPDGTWNAKSRVPTYPTYNKPTLDEAVQAALDARALVGGIIAVKDSGTSNARWDIPTTRNLNWVIKGQGDQNTVVTAGATHPAVDMVECAKAGWGSPQDQGTVHIDAISFNPNNIAHGLFNLPYTIMDIGRVYVSANVPSGHSLISGGGSGGPTHPAMIKSLKFHYVTNTRNNKLLDLWYDTLQIQQLAAAVNMGSATQDVFEFDGESIDIGQLVYYVGASGTVRNIVVSNSTYMTIQNALLITSAPAATVGAFLKASGDGVTLGRLQDGIPCTATYADDTTKGLVTRLDVGGVSQLNGGGVNTQRTDGVAEYFLAGSLNTTELGRSVIMKRACFIDSINVAVNTAPTAGKSYTYTVMKNGSATSMAAVIADANTSASSTANPVTCVAGDRISVRSQGAGTPTASVPIVTLGVRNL